MVEINVNPRDCLCQLSPDFCWLGNVYNEVKSLLEDYVACQHSDCYILKMPGGIRWLYAWLKDHPDICSVVNRNESSLDQMIGLKTHRFTPASGHSSGRVGHMTGYVIVSLTYTGYAESAIGMITGTPAPEYALLISQLADQSLNSVVHHPTSNSACRYGKYQTRMTD